MRIPMTILFTLLGIFAALWMLVIYLEKHAVFFPGKVIFNTPEQMRLPYEDLTLTTKDNVKINVWLIKGKPDAATIVYAHGNAGTMGDRLLKVRFFHDLGLNVFIFDYRGFGKSEGVPTEKGVYLDAEAAYDYIKTRSDINQSKLIAYGSSLGGVVAIDLATKRSFAMLIVDSSFTSAKDLAAIFYPYVPRFLMRIEFNSMKKIGDIKIPKIFIHSPDDHTVPFAMGKRLFDKAVEPKIFIQSTGGHSEIQILNDRPTADAMKNYLRTQGLL